MLLTSFANLSLLPSPLFNQVLKANSLANPYLQDRAISGRKMQILPKISKDRQKKAVGS
jgi:hypothetical protein